MGLPREHCDLAHNIEYSSMPFYVLEFFKNSKPIRYEEPLHGLKTINRFRKKGMTIPFKKRKVLNVRVGHRFTVQEKFDYDCFISVKELSEVHHSMLSVKDQIVSRIIVFDDIPLADCKLAEEISRGLYDCGGKVKQSPLKKSDDIVMFGNRRNMEKKSGSPDTFCRYSHMDMAMFMKRLMPPYELKEFADYLINTFLYLVMSQQFPSYVQEVENMLDNGFELMCLGRNGRQGLTILAITSNYYVQSHLDVEDIGFGFLFWFVKDREGPWQIKSGGEFLLPGIASLSSPKMALQWFFPQAQSYIAHMSLKDMISLVCLTLENTKFKTLLQDVL